MEIENYKHAKELGLIKPYWLGKKRSEETKKLISEKHKGKVSKLKGAPIKKEVKEKISNTLKGNIPWNKGLKYKIKK
jgi:hypothetical protein